MVLLPPVAGCATPGTLRAQRALATHQGTAGVWFAGGFTHPFDSQETALLSAITVAEALAPDSANLETLRALLAG